MKLTKILLAGALSASSLLGHGLWINAFEASSHGSKLVTVGLGTGHNPTIEDSISDRLSLKSFDLITQDGKKIALKKPAKGLEDIYDKNNLKIVDSNLAMQKVSFGKKSDKGTYSVALATNPNTFIKYIDTKGEEKFSRKAKSEIRNLKEIISTTKGTTFAKTYFVNQEWTQPKAVGHTLELIPTTDISKLAVGDTVVFDVLYDGKALKSGSVTAKSALAKNENALYSSVRKGKAKFVLTHKGQWMFTINDKQVKGEITHSNTASATINIQ
ncbi:MAG: DUF4198 domain-containing protein [Arcobacteraceae bacterium]